MFNKAQMPQSCQTDVTSSPCSVDCLDLITDLLVFESEDDFYFLQILQRKKENAELGLSLINISEPTRRHHVSRMPSSA